MSHRAHLAPFRSPRRAAGHGPVGPDHAGRRGRHRLVAGLATVALGLALGAAAPLPARAAVLFGNDVSWPQCAVSQGGAGLPMPPTTTQFVVVGLTRGLPFTANPCLSSQVAWVRAHATPAQAYTMAGFPTAAQQSAYGASGPWSASTRAGRLSNVGYAEATYAATTLAGVGWRPPLVWIDVEPRPAQPWPSGSWAQQVENRYVVEGLMRGLRDRGYSYGLYSNASGWATITGSWRLPGVPVWATAGTLDYPTEALDRCTQPSFSGGHVYLSQWWTSTADFDRTCAPWTFTPLRMPDSTLTASTGDVDGDWRTDVMARWTASGAVRLYSGTGTGSLSLGRQVATGWSGFDALDTVGDLDGTGSLDVVVRERATGYLWLYRGDGRGGWVLPRLRIGTGWGGMNAIVGPGDLTGDGRPDLLARRTSDGSLWVYPGTGHASWPSWQPRILVATWWNGYDRLLPVGDVTNDGRPDLMTRERTTGRLWLHPGSGTGGFRQRVLVGSGWGAMTALASPGDFDGNRVGDVLARDRAGVLWLYPRTATGGWSPRRQVSTGWNITNAIF